MIASNLIEPLARLARERGFEPAAILAVVDVESGGRIFTRIEGRDEPLIRFEGHYFDRRLSGARRARARALGLAHPHAGMVANPASQAARYRLLSRAEAIDRDAARESCSWGAGQVMGANWSWLGYGSVDALVDEARAGAEGQVRLMLAFIVKAGLADALAQRDWHAFARRYNGPAYASNGYHTRLARAFAAYAAMELKDVARPAPPAPADILREGMHGPGVAALQRRLSALGYPLAIDGAYGPRTRAAVASFQQDHGLATDGIAGPRTRMAMEGISPWRTLWAWFRATLARITGSPGG